MDIVERLKRVKYTRERNDAPNGFSWDEPCDADDYGAEQRFVNPDGPEAADEIERLREALDQVLDDMGAEGRSVCGATKAQARYALGYNVDPEFDYYPLERAISVLVEVGEFRTAEEAYAALKEGE